MREQRYELLTERVINPTRIGRTRIERVHRDSVLPCPVGERRCDGDQHAFRGDISQVGCIRSPGYHEQDASVRMRRSFVSLDEGERQAERPFVIDKIMVTERLGRERIDTHVPLIRRVVDETARSTERRFDAVEQPFCVSRRQIIRLVCDTGA